MNYFEELQQIPRWVSRNTSESLTNKEKKIPIMPNGKPASSTNPSTWSTYDDCVESKYGGLGFVLTKQAPTISCIDLDHCVENGVISQYALQVLRFFASGSEISQSGTGIHIFGYGEIPAAIKTKKIEVYSTGRYIAITGNIILNTPLMNIQNALDRVYTKHRNNQIKRDIKISKPISVDEDTLDTFLNIKRFKLLWTKEIEFLKDDGSVDSSMFDFHIAASLKNEQPEKVLWVMQEFRRLNGAPRKHLGALKNAIQKTNIYQIKK